MNKAIELKGLTKKFGEKTAVDHIGLNVNEGEIFGLLGVNGAGKTTTIRMLTGLSVPTEGEAKVLGLDLRNDLDKIKLMVNVSTQETSIAGNLTVEENLKFIAGIYGVDKTVLNERLEDIYSSLELGEVKNQRSKTLSGGWQRRLSIAMALITGPKLIFLDEPTLGLDVLARRELWRFVKKLKGKVTIVLTTHYLDEVEALCDTIAVMAKGKVLAVGTADELKKSVNKETLEDAFVEIVGGEKT
ncbi:MAG: ABC transporter ATP-binding protein [Clostridia bacterium]|nr:ABC transporter ATP-binding protein [Clostridia bacterium]